MTLYYSNLCNSKTSIIRTNFKVPSAKLSLLFEYSECKPSIKTFQRLFIWNSIFASVRSMECMFGFVIRSTIYEIFKENSFFCCHFSHKCFFLFSKFPFFLSNSNFHQSSLKVRIRETFYYTNLSIIRTKIYPPWVSN